MATSKARVTRSGTSSVTRKTPKTLKPESGNPASGLSGAEKRRAVRPSRSRSSETDSSGTDEPAPKRRKAPTSKKNRAAAAQLHKRLFGSPEATVLRDFCSTPARRHGLDYHRPILLHDADSRAALLAWFDGVSTKRSMPWRKAWINPRDHEATELRHLLERRAYEVWISEIMLQQTRVAVVIDYWNRWMAKWPTIHDLAAASSDDVLGAWRGLGYYSRATRIHEAAKLVVGDALMKGQLPSGVEELESKVPGVGRYTAGAISAIVFGRAVPMVDGNVLRVLSRQLGLLGNVKTDKTVIDTMWAAADALANAIAKDAPNGNATPEELERSNRPGRWGQALMELGSTICTPKPNCDQCPIRSSCRAYGEGKALAAGSTATNGAKLPDIEDFCHLCEPLDDVEEDDEDSKATKPSKPSAEKGKQTKLWAFAFRAAEEKKAPPKQADDVPSGRELEIIVDHARKFPVKVTKKAVRVEETLVCAIRRSDGQYLIQKRPEKGLLAGLWEFPSYILQDADESDTTMQRKARATSFASQLLGQHAPGEAQLRHRGELGSVPWLFSHIKLTMHLHMFTLDACAPVSVGDGRSKWASDVQVDKESMGTGMRKCLDLVKDFSG